MDDTIIIAKQLASCAGCVRSAIEFVVLLTNIRQQFNALIIILTMIIINFFSHNSNDKTYLPSPDSRREGGGSLWVLSTAHLHGCYNTSYQNVRYKAGKLKKELSERRKSMTFGIGV